MKKIFLSDTAEAEFVNAVEYYTEISASLGSTFYRHIMSALMQIQQFPDGHPQYNESYRYLILKKFPYLIIYRNEQDFVLVEAVANAYRNR